MAHFVIDSKEKLQEKLQNLEAIKDMCIVDKIMQKGSKAKKENYKDVNYRELNCKLNHLDPKVRKTSSRLRPTSSSRSTSIILMTRLSTTSSKMYSKLRETESSVGLRRAWGRWVTKCYSGMARE